MLSDNDIKEELSYAYVHAVAARAGFSCDRPFKDRDSVDVTISGKGRLATDSVLISPKLDLQLKATACPPPTGDRFAFRLPMKNYNELREEEPHLPRLLVVFTMPEDAREWLNHAGDALLLRRCAYWHNLRGAPDSGNVTTQNVSLSRYNVFSPEALRSLLTQVSRRQEIGDAL